jgi:hypothetical protein
MTAARMKRSVVQERPPARQAEVELNKDRMDINTWILTPGGGWCCLPNIDDIRFE